MTDWPSPPLGTSSAGFRAKNLGSQVRHFQRQRPWYSPDRLEHDHTSFLRHNRIILRPRNMRHTDREIRHDIRVPDIFVSVGPATDRVWRRDSCLGDPFSGRIEFVFDKGNRPDRFGGECCAFRDPAVGLREQFRLLTSSQTESTLTMSTCAYLFRHDLVSNRLLCRVVLVVFVDKAATEMSPSSQPAMVYGAYLQYRCRSVSTMAAASLADP